MRKVIHRVAVAVFAAHGLIHLMGVGKGFGWAEIPALTQAISVPLAGAWLLAAVLVLTAAAMLARHAPTWWLVAGVAGVVSQAVIFTSWSDALAGTAANLFMAVATGYGYASEGRHGLRAQYRRRRDAALDSPPPSRPGTVSEKDLGGLPPAVAAYVRRSGAVGQPRVVSFHALIHGRIRSAPDKPWMTFTGEQLNTFDSSPQRFFLLDATMAGLPVDVLHVYTKSSATMRAKVCSLVPIVDAKGPDMDRGESVTLLNDLCILAPAALVDAPIEWQELDDHRVRARYTGGAVPISADLVFDAAGDLVDFVSHDRLRASPDGRSFTLLPWSTPIGGYRTTGRRRVATTGEGRWTAPPPEGDFSYLEFRLDRITYHHAPEVNHVDTYRLQRGRRPRGQGRPRVRLHDGNRD